MTNAPELLSRLQEVGRCMALPFPGAADEVLIASRALAQTTEAESPEIAAAGGDFAKAAEGVSDSTAPYLRLHLSLQTLMSRIQAAAESSQVGRVWAAAQNLAEHDMILRPQLRRISLKTRRIKIATFLQNCLDRCRF
jgi:DNA-binding IclR family transcriptional regulator